MGSADRGKGQRQREEVNGPTLGQGRKYCEGGEGEEKNGPATHGHPRLAGGSTVRKPLLSIRPFVGLAPAQNGAQMG